MSIFKGMIAAQANGQVRAGTGRQGAQLPRPRGGSRGRELLPGDLGPPALRGAPCWRRGDLDRDRDRAQAARAGTLRLSSGHTRRPLGTLAGTTPPTRHVRAALHPA